MRPARHDFTIVDVFTDRPFGGNQLAVLHDARGLSTADMQRVTREFSFPETTFVLPSESRGSTARVRIFSPGMEMPFAGHPTVGTAAVLVALGRAADSADGVTRVLLEERIGVVPVEVSRRGDCFHSTLVLDTPVEIDRDPPPSGDLLADVLTLDRSDVEEVWTAGAGIAFTFCRLRDQDAVDRAVLDRHRWAADLAGTWAEAVYLFAGRVEDGGEVYARMFHPAAGIEEDPATGSAAAALVASARVRTASHARHALRIVQGCRMGRPSHLEASVLTGPDARPRIRVGGGVVVVASGVIDV